MVGDARPGASITVHQSAKFYVDLNANHDVAVKRIGECLLNVEEKILILAPDARNGLEACAGADFARCFDKACNKVLNFLITWKSKIQTEINLSNIKAIIHHLVRNYANHVTIE